LSHARSFLHVGGLRSSFKKAPRAIRLIALLDDLNYYWTVSTPPGFDAKDPYFLMLFYFSLEIGAGEWVKYVAVMSNSIKITSTPKEKKLLSCKS
jgi:hypothetical protein